MSAVVEELISAVEHGPLGLEHDQALLFQAEPTGVGGWAVGLSPGHQGPGDEVVLVLLHPLVLQAPDVR